MKVSADHIERAAWFIEIPAFTLLVNYSIISHTASLLDVSLVSLMLSDEALMRFSANYSHVLVVLSIQWIFRGRSRHDERPAAVIHQYMYQNFLSKYLHTSEVVKSLR